MKEEENIKSELMGISPYWEKITRQNPFIIPEGYFETLASRIFEKMEGNEFFFQKGVQSPLDAPAGYFDSLSQRILQKINQDKDTVSKNAETIDDMELAGIAPILHGMKKQNVYAIPDNYFVTREWIATPERQKPVAKLVQLPAWAQYLVAASVFAIISIGAVFYVGSRQAAPTPATLFSKSLDNLSDSAISNYLVSEPVYSLGVNTPINQTLDVQSMIFNMTNQQIEQYLNETNDLILPNGQNI